MLLNTSKLQKGAQLLKYRYLWRKKFPFPGSEGPHLAKVGSYSRLGSGTPLSNTPLATTPL